jgi:tetratricopeptide (TPR) repeat protein
MTRIVTIAAVVLLATLIVGCEANTGTSQLLPPRTATYTPPDPNRPLTTPATSGEIDLVEKMAGLRRDYRSSLQAMIQYYSASGNHQKVTWAREELTALDRIPQYQYIIEAEIMPATLKATDRIPAADQMYQEAEKLRRDAGFIPLMITKDVQLLRAALRKYGQLISSYPTSDKIDDAAYKMGEIHEGLGDYTIAVKFYQRAYQWDPATPYPARFQQAEILDKKLHNRAEALKVYQEAIEKEGRYTDRRLMAERRVQELNTSKDSPK